MILQSYVGIYYLRLKKGYRGPTQGRTASPKTSEINLLSAEIPKFYILSMFYLKPIILSIFSFFSRSSSEPKSKGQSAVNDD